jgi:hypothetical protein
VGGFRVLTQLRARLYWLGDGKAYNQKIGAGNHTWLSLPCGDLTNRTDFSSYYFGVGHLDAVTMPLPSDWALVCGFCVTYTFASERKFGESGDTVIALGLRLICEAKCNDTVATQLYIYVQHNERWVSMMGGCLTD